MPTTVTSTLGTGRDYTTWQAWADDLPGDIRAGTGTDEIQVAEAYNDAEFTDAVLIPGVLTDATHYLHLTAAAGEAWCDSDPSDALDYDQSRGVGINISDGFVNAIEFSSAFTRITRLQIKTTSGTPLEGVFAANARCEDLILSYGGHGYGGARALGIDSGLFVNVLSILRSSAPANGQHVYNDGTFIGGGAVRKSNFTAGDTAYSTSYGTMVMRSCFIFGFTTPVAGGSWSGGNNATNLASGLPGSSNQHSVTYSASTPFEEASDTGTDFRPLDGSALEANGFLDATNAPNDGYGRPRPSSPAPTIGPVELNPVVAGATDVEGALVAGGATLGASVLVQRSASASMSIPEAALASVASIQRSASGAVIVPPSALQGVAEGQRSSQGALAVPAVGLSSAAAVERAAAGALQVPGTDLAAGVSNSQSLAASLGVPSLTSDAAASIARHAAGVLATRAPAAAASVAAARAVSAALDIAGTELEAQAAIAREVSVSATVPALDLLGLIGGTRVAVGSMVIAGVTLEADTFTTRHTSAALQTPPMDAEATVARTIEATGTAAIPALQLTAVASIVRLASGDLAIAVPILAGAAAGEDLTVSALLVAPAPTLSADALVTRSAVGALELRAPVLDGDAIHEVTVHGVLVLHAPDLAAQAAIARFAAGSLDLPSTVLHGVAVVGAIQSIVGLTATVVDVSKSATVVDVARKAALE